MTPYVTAMQHGGTALTACLSAVGDEPVIANPEEAEALRQQIEKVRAAQLATAAARVPHSAVGSAWV